MRKSLILGIVALLAASMIGMAPTAHAGKAGRVEIGLNGSAAFPDAKGKARSDAQEFRVEVENVPALAGQTLTVSVDGNPAGTATVDALGAARLNLDAQLGDTLPVVRAGSLVEVRTAAGVLVASGRFP